MGQTNYEVDSKASFDINQYGSIKGSETDQWCLSVKREGRSSSLFASDCSEIKAGICELIGVLQ